VDVHRTELGGIPMFWSDAPGRFMGLVVFRAGRSDETLPWSGVCHLVEHLALPTEYPRSLEFNGTVDTLTTAFWALGPRERVLEFLAQLVSSLGALPLERIETERRILLTEASRSDMHPIDGSLNLRFGAQGPGLRGLDELGLHRLSPDDVMRWSAERYTRGNAAAFLTGEPPDDTAWKLPPGDRITPPEPQPIPYLELPAVHVGGTTGMVVVAFVAERSTDLRVVIAIAERRARRRLRYALGVTYEVSWSYDPLTGDLVHLTIWADSLPANANDVARELVAVLDDLAETGPTEEELEEEVEQGREWHADPENVSSNLAYWAVEELLGHEFQTDEELIAELAAVTPASAARALSAGLETALLVLPAETRPPDARFTPYPVFSPERVSGKAHALRGLNVSRAARKTRLVLGDDGVSLLLGDEDAITVRFDECVALERWSTGDRALWSTDGFRLEIVTEAWRGGDAVIRAVDERVPPELVIPMDREVEERIAEVDALADEKVKRSWMTADELKALPSLLAPGERVVSLAQASKGWRNGVLVLTERRLLFLFLEDLVEATDVAAIESVDTTPPSWLVGATLSLTTADGELEYSDLKEERASELADELRRLLRPQ
jgi:hypothetical protein